MSPPARPHRLVVPATLLAVVVVYAAVHAALLHRLAQAVRLQDSALGALSPSPLATGAAAWLPIGSTVRFAALAAVAVALAAAGRRWAAALPAAVLLVDLPTGGGRPLPLDAAWSKAIWSFTSATPPESATRLWAGSAADAALMLLPALVVVLSAPRLRPALPVRTVLVRCLPLLACLALLQQYLAAGRGASPAHAVLAAVLVVGAGLLASGCLPRRCALSAVAVLPAVAVEQWSWPLAGHPEGLTGAAQAAGTAAVLALVSAGVVLLAPAAARAWSSTLRQPATAGSRS